MSESHREAFEGRAFNLYFLMSIEKNPKPPRGTGAMDFISTATKTQAELCKRNENGTYVDLIVEQLWSGWQLALGGHEHLGDIAGKAGAQASHDVMSERRDQRRRWSLQHDDEHDGGELALAAAAYAITAGRNVYTEEPAVPLIWPWEDKWWKPRSARDDLVRAGALILAEIERLDRAAGQKPE